MRRRRRRERAQLKGRVAAATKAETPMIIGMAEYLFFHAKGWGQAEPATKAESI